jgi:hypothetical protein
MKRHAVRNAIRMIALFASYLAFAGNKSQTISNPNDLGWLEKITSSLTVAEEEAQKADFASLKMMVSNPDWASEVYWAMERMRLDSDKKGMAKVMQTVAYLHLKQLGTDEARAALKRIDDEANKDANDVTRLEKIVRSFAAAEEEVQKFYSAPPKIASDNDFSDVINRLNDMRDKGRLVQLTKGSQTGAYLQLGNLGTEEALAALDRIEAEAKKVTLTPEKVAMGVWPHAVGHFEVGRVEPLTQVRTPNGTTYGVVLSGILGGPGDFFLVWTKTPQDATSWSRPRLLPQRIFPGIDKPVLTAKDDDNLVLSYIQRKPPARNLMDGTDDQGRESPVKGKQKLEFSISEVCKDSDGDGWTDIEEKRLGLDPQKADTDGDGIPDGQDVCPDYAPSAKDASDEDVEIIQKVVFATYGLSGSRDLLIASITERNMQLRKVQLWGYGGPVLYNPPGNWHKDHPGTFFVGWSVKHISETEASVALRDYEGSLASSWMEVFLRKIGRRWVVVKFGGGLIS